MTPRSLEVVRKELRDIRAEPFVTALRHFGLSQRLFFANDLRLTELLAALVENEWGLDLFGIGMDSVRTLVLEEFTRRLHNYVAAAGALVNHTRRHPAIANDPALRQQVRDEIRARFLDNDLVHFVHDLRNYAMHYELPPVVFEVRRQRGRPTERRLILQTKDLFAGTYRWVEPARQFIEAADDQIVIGEMRAAYSDQVLGIQHWINEHLSPETKTLLAKQNELLHELRQATLPAHYDIVKTLLSLVENGIGTAEDLPRLLLRTDQIRAARLEGGGVITLLDVVKSEYPSMPVELQERLSKLLNHLARFEQDADDS